MKRRKFIGNTLLASAGLTLSNAAFGRRNALVRVDDYASDWHQKGDGTWIGEAFWANRLQDWRMEKGGVETVIRGKNRSLALLTHELGKASEPFSMQVDLQFLDKKLDKDLVGFRIGNVGRIDDYRSTAIYGKGMRLGLLGNGKLLLGQKQSDERVSESDLSKKLTLQLSGKPIHSDLYALQLTVSEGRRQLLEIKGYLVGNKEIIGGIALLHDADTELQQELQPGVRFERFLLRGTKLVGDPSRTFGPIMFAQYTLDKQTIKLSAQLAPIGAGAQRVDLFIKEGKDWKKLDTAQVDPVSRVAAFRISDWLATTPIPYKLQLQGHGSSYEGSFAPAPTADQPVKLGLFSCNCDHGFPDTDLRSHILYHNIDAALFLGDQFYEGTGGFGVEETSLDRSILDYLRKWYQFGWSYRDVFRHIPCVSIPDDHDVYHGNLWGEEGKEALKEGAAYVRQDSGGYKMHPEWVTMVQQTQASHLPDAYDPTPVKNGVSVYYTDWNWGPYSFAILEDRKFKSAPQHIFPKEAGIQNGFITNPDFKDETYLNAPNAELLGSRQEQFLENWVADWKHGARMKIVLSQTNFCTVATLPKGSLGDSMVPKLEIPELGTYVAGDDMTRDMDSNGWPHSKRNKAVDIIRRGYTLHLAGDQHIASVVRYGVDSHDDAGFAFAGPALNNIFPRRWWPDLPKDHQPLPGKPSYTGKFEDGFKNKITLHAVASPRKTGLEPAIIHDRATGYGIVKIDPTTRDITMECWKRSADPAKDQANGQYDGWPITVNQFDNYDRQAFEYLPELEVVDQQDAVVQVLNEGNGEVLYTLRLVGDKFRAKVFEEGSYTLRVGDPDKGIWKELKGLKTGKKRRRKQKTLKVRLA
ncbi:PhoD-like phosphatase [Dyadobacter jejuensis]|uniref:PhoD-like phosphatase n=1 Tax=Dyadobacter jejuensis TaxID=1082580 RepID=A0A316ABC0_9BACT|nr:alkaline phosphatase D family protein [Dyadobacter jejuensis]PWJ54538.1 PhoD-like phosphatase [Dyadobacter jejuensis]